MTHRIGFATLYGRGKKNRPIVKGCNSLSATWNFLLTPVFNRSSPVKWRFHHCNIHSLYGSFGYQTWMIFSEGCASRYGHGSKFYPSCLVFTSMAMFKHVQTPPFIWENPKLLTLQKWSHRLFDSKLWNMVPRSWYHHFISFPQTFHKMRESQQKWYG